MSSFRSLSFVRAHKHHLIRQHSASNRRTFTIASLFKRASAGTRQVIAVVPDAQMNMELFIDESNRLAVYGYYLELVSSETIAAGTGWHHANLGVDTTQVSANSRATLSLDSVEVTYQTRVLPNQNVDILYASPLNWFWGSNSNQ